MECMHGYRVLLYGRGRINNEKKKRAVDEGGYIGKRKSWVDGVRNT